MHRWSYWRLAAFGALAPTFGCTGEEAAEAMGDRTEPRTASDIEGLPEVPGQPDDSASEDSAPEDTAPDTVSDGSPTFSVERGFFDEPFDVTLESTVGTVYYTTDGSTPSATEGEEYTEPISIETTTPLRAVAVQAGGLSTPVITHTYIRLADVLEQPDDPRGYPSHFAVNDGLGPYPADYEMDPDVVEDPRYREILEPALRDLPTLSIVTDISNLFDESTGIYYNPSEVGDAWERPTSVEMFDAAAGSVFAADAGIRIHGQASRKPSWTPKRGFRVYFRSSYGVGRLQVPLFSGTDAVTSFDALVLRSIPNYSWLSHSDSQRKRALYMRDEFARRTQLAMGHLSAHGRFVHAYVNGLYWGIYNLVERVDDEFLADYRGGGEDGWDLVEMWNGELVADEGDLAEYQELMALANAGVATERQYEEVQERLDVENFIDYLIVMHWVQNSDWPHHNWFAARKREAGEKFFFLAWDADTSLSSVDKDITTVDLDGSPARLFLRLCENADFRMLYADRVFAHLVEEGGALTTTEATARFHELVDPLERPVAAESARWGDYVRDVYRSPEMDPGIMELYTQADHWIPARDFMLADYFPERTEVVIEQYRDLGLYPEIEAPRFNLAGPEVHAGAVLEIDNRLNAGLGEVVYRVDGGDPREPGGALSPSAIRGEDLARIPLSVTTRVRARVYSGGAWSPIREGTFTVRPEPER